MSSSGVPRFRAGSTRDSPGGEEGRSGGAPAGWQSWDTLARIVRRRFVRGFLLTVTLCGKSASIPAAADESPGVPAPPSQPAVESGAGAAQGRGAVQLRTTQRWYGGQILLVDWDSESSSPHLS